MGESNDNDGDTLAVNIFPKGRSVEELSYDAIWQNCRWSGKLYWIFVLAWRWQRNL